jgi:hypothetical protein
MALVVGSKGAARAEGISGYFDLTYSHFNSETRDAVGGTTKVDSGAFIQRYNLALSKTFFPTVTMAASGLFDRIDSSTETDGVKSDASNTRIQPYVSLTLNTPLIMVQGTYLLTEEKAKSNGVSSPTFYRQQAGGSLGYRPDRFPSLNLQYTQSENYDSSRSVRDTVDDVLNVNSLYSPVKDLQLTYAGTFDDFKDKLVNNEFQTRTNSGTVQYSSRWWKNRLTFYGNYNLTQRSTEVTTSGKGEIPFLRSPFAGLVGLSDTPALVALLPNPALIDGNTTVPAGIDIGLFPPGPESARPRNIGLDFVVDTEVNTLYVWVDKKLPINVSTTYAWDIYTSLNNQDWTLRQTVTPAPFGAFDNRFEINFQNVTARYIKVVTRPLAQLPPPTVEDPDPTIFRNIQVTELQAYLRVAAQSVSGKTSITTQFLNLDARVRLLDVPSVYYEVTYFRNQASPNPPTSILTNALSSNHQINRVLSGSWRVSREDNDSERGLRVTYNYYASLIAVPLPTLSHNLNFSGRSEEFEGRKADSNSVFLFNSAELYKGINVNLSGGINRATSETGVKNESTQWSFGASLIPHRTLNVNMSYSSTNGKQSGGNQPDKENKSSAGEISVSFTPFPTLFLFGDWAVFRQTGQPTDLTQNYTLAWSPFPGGTLHFNFPYTETRRSSNDQKDRAFSPNILWNITSRTSFSVSYAWQRSETPLQEFQQNGFVTNLRANF